MPIEKPRRFANFSNIDYLNSIRGLMTNDYQARIPVLTKANREKSLRDLDNYLPGQNAILAMLLNKVGMTNFNSDQWDNTLAEFVKATLAYGESVEEVQLGLINAISYDSDRETGEKLIFSRKDIEHNAWYHTINRQVIYPITLDNQGGEITKAFHSENGLNSYLTAVMSALHTSAQFDEFTLMTSLLADYEEKGGFYKVNVPDVAASTSDEAAAKKLLRYIREYAAEMTYPSRRYNAAGMPTFARPEDLIILATPGVKAALDVEALAQVFNMDKAEVPARIVTIPKDKWRIDGAQAILTTVNFFQVYNVLAAMTEMSNPVGLYSNHFLHVQQVISYSLAVPAVLFTTKPGTVDSEFTFNVTGLGTTTIKDLDGVTVTNVTRGSAYELSTTAQVDKVGGETGVGYVLNQRGTSVNTRIGTGGVVLVGYDEQSTELSYVVYSVADPEVRAIRKLKVAGTIVEEWPVKVTEPTP